MRLHEIFLAEGRDAALFHGYSEPKYASMALRDNRMAGTSVQRFWDDGKRRLDDDPEYDGSYWMKGISLTRDMIYAMQWGSIVFKLDQRKIAQRHKIIPFHWGYSIPDPMPGSEKREREEFVVLKATKDRYVRDDGRLDNERWNEPGGYLNNLSDILLGIYLEDDLGKYIWPSMEANGVSVQDLINHPKFLGYYKCGRAATGKIISPRTPPPLYT